MSATPGVGARRLAVEALVRIEADGAYANLVTPALLARSDLEARDRALVTDLVYGTTRMRRACQYLVDRHRRSKAAPRVAAAMRLGAYQLAFGGVAPHAAVAATVGAVPKAARGLVNAVLRRVSEDVQAGIEWPDLGTELSQPDWIVAALVERLGTSVAHDALRAMNLPAPVHRRDDGYVQDLSSQAVVAAVHAGQGMRVLDCCAAPGGKATGLAASGASVLAGDLDVGRMGLVRTNAGRLGTDLGLFVADATKLPFPPASFDRVLVDAPCSGLGVLRRRPDARWRIDADAPSRLAGLQRRMLEEAAPLVAPGGRLVYSVCTLTESENAGVRDAASLDGLVLAGDQTVVPDRGSDGMYLAWWERPASVAAGVHVGQGHPWAPRVDGPNVTQ